MDAVFRALADPTRRAIFELLTLEELPVHALTERAGVSQPAVSKRLPILEQAGLVRDRHEGRQTQSGLRSDQFFAVLEHVSARTD